MSTKVHTDGASEKPYNPPAVDPPLARAKRKPRRAKTDRGLPPDEELTAFARVYLECQHKHWPKLVGTAVLPRLADVIIAAMVVDCKNRHRTGNVDKDDLARLKEYGEKIGGEYGRYSCDNSVTSLPIFR
jgi:hypothetical protein